MPEHWVGELRHDEGGGGGGRWRDRRTDLLDVTYPLYLYLAEESAKTSGRLHGGREDEDIHRDTKKKEETQP